MDNPFGFLSDMFSPASAGAPTSLAPPDQPAPTPDSANLPVNGVDPNSPTFKGFLGALNAGVHPSALQLPKPPAAPQIAMPQPHQMAAAQTLAQVMAALNAKNNLQPGLPQR